VGKNMFAPLKKRDFSTIEFEDGFKTLGKYWNPILKRA